eukprot:1877704-Prymnesium_polylepis.1
MVQPGHRLPGAFGLVQSGHRRPGAFGLGIGAQSLVRALAPRFGSGTVAQIWLGLRGPRRHADGLQLRPSHGHYRQPEG